MGCKLIKKLDPAFLAVEIVYNSLGQMGLFNSCSANLQDVFKQGKGSILL